MAKDGTEFSRIRSFLWPINRLELVKFVPLMIIFFLISINYHLLRIAKDALIITAPNSGAEVLPFLKVWVVLPAALLEAFIFTRLMNRFSKEKVFYIIIGFMLTFLLFFALIFYPYRESLYPDQFANFLQSHLPPGCKGFVAIIRYWMFSLFYVIAESWSFLVLTVLVWGFANDVTSIEESGRFYALFGIAINFSGILTGELANFLTSSNTIHISKYTKMLGGTTPWDQTVYIFLGIILVCGILAIATYRWIHVHILPPDHTARKNLPKEEKPRMSIRETLAYVAKSKYLISIAMIVLSYNIVINFTEVLWKAQLKELYPDPQHYAAYTSKVVLCIGCLATLGSIFVSGNLIRRSGWKVTALITPIIVTVTGLGFFYFLFFEQFMKGSPILILGLTPLALAVFFGSLQNACTRASKYTVFDSTKEIAFIPLSPESRMKGKAAIDGIGSRLGKSGSSLILQVLLIFFNTLLSCSPIIFAAVLLIIPIWILAINVVSKKFGVLTQENKAST
ncbi:MAG: Npt1/Npt2 family nucleotide transporter [Chlamydiota bacterium]